MPTTCVVIGCGNRSNRDKNCGLTMRRLILGAGIGGLSAGHYLLKKFPGESLTILEAASRTGGWINSAFMKDGVIFEQGPRTIRPRGASALNTMELIEELHLEDEIFPIPSTSPAATNRMIYANGELHSLPSSFGALFEKRPPFSKPLCRFLMNDLFAKKKPLADESIYDFVCRRFGSEVADYLISPMVCGICAGDAKEISVNLLMKQLFQYEQKYGNIYKGLVRDMFMPAKKPVASALAKRAKSEKWSIYSFRGGIQTLTDALEKEIKNKGGEIVFNSNCEKITMQNGEVQISLSDGKTIVCDQLISSLPAHVLGGLLPQEHSSLAGMLKDIKTVNVGVVNLHFKEQLIQNPGFGFLVAPKENIPILGVIYDSCCFPRHNDTVFTVMLGGHWFEHYFGQNPIQETFLKVSLQYLNSILGVKSEPVQYKINILKQCIPQYRVGHEQNVQNILRCIESHQLPLYLCGASYYGAGVNDVILSSRNVINSL